MAVSVSMSELREQMDQVFDKKGNVKLCGRETCKKLIELASNAFPGENFGNAETGFLELGTFKRYFFEHSEILSAFDAYGHLISSDYNTNQKLLKLASWFYPAESFVDERGVLNLGTFHAVFMPNLDS